MTDIVQLNEKREPEDALKALNNLIDQANQSMASAIAANDTKLMNSSTTALKQLVAQRRALVPAQMSAEDAAEAIKADIRVWLADRDYHYVLGQDRYWLRDGTSWMPVTEKALQHERLGLRDAMEFALFMDVMREDRRWFDRCTYTFKPVPANVLNMMRVDFCPRQSGEYHWIFDTLLASIGGGKADNIEHIERLMVAKYLHPENVQLPALIFQDEGGTGKSVFVATVCATLFGQSAVADNLSMDTVCGKFNAQLEGKALWFINEAARGRYSLDDLKRIVGSDRMTVEHKGLNSFEIDMTALIFISGNDVDGSVMLSGGGVDRRWSIVIGGEPISNHLARKMDCDTATALDWLFGEGKAILSDRDQVGRWINAMIEKHGDVRRLEALHGGDYAKLRRDQKSIEDRLFEAVFADDHFSHIKCSTLFDLYTRFCKEAARKPKARSNLYAMLEAWARRENVDVSRGEHNISINGQRSKVAFFRSKGAMVEGTNDGRYWITDDFGRSKPAIDLG
ncbi:primase-helicase family protein [Sphingobium sp. WW5]|uniref:DUF5906 domain-containing protein n=1 Tax=unclassified Sphingobium TaxID=2611147 RepID=UPI003C1BF67C